MIAAEAGVTPSTLYRRWGDLPQLLADVALARMRPDGEPLDSGALATDLRAWAEQYAEEMASPLGVAMMRDVVAADSRATDSPPCRCAQLTRSQLAVLLDRARQRGEAAPSVEAVMDRVVAPVVYRALFGPAPADAGHVAALVDECLREVGGRKKKPGRSLQ